MYSLLVALTQPLVWLFAGLGLALVSLWRNHRESRRRLGLILILFVLLYALFTPAVAYFALGTLEWKYPPLEGRPEGIQAIVVLSGYVRPLDDEGSRVELGEDSLYRCLRAAEVYRLLRPCPVVVSGGKPDPNRHGPALAVPMRDFLVTLGVRPGDLIVEDRSRTTYENAVETCNVLAARKLTRILLVTDATHLQRAVACFRKQGVEVVPCGCRYRARRMQWSVDAFLPDPGAAEAWRDAWHEWLGGLWYSLTDRT
jgi:uncharacterized SAM-binding protein YcdF (DUF218 family)